MTTKEWIEVIIACTGPVGILGLLIQRIYGGYGIGARAVQFAAVVLVIPALVLLGLERVLDSNALGPLIAGIAGYVLWKVGEYVPDKKSSEKDAINTKWPQVNHSVTPEPDED